MRDAGEIAALVAAGVVPNLAWLAVGLWLVRRAWPVARGAERWALAWALGSGAASLAILALRAADVPLPLPALAVVALLGIPALRSPAPRAPAPSAPAPGWARAVDAATVALALLTFAAALGPETSWDGLAYHLPMVAAWSEGPIRALPALLDAELRAGVDLLFLPAVAAGHPAAAAAVSACFALALCALVRAEARRRASAGAGALAGAFTLVVSFTLQNAPTVYVDLGVGLYGFLALLFVDRWNRGAPQRALGLAALFAAFALNAKLHAAALLPALALLALLGGRRPAARHALACGALFACASVPWFVKAAATTGNPLFPLACGWLGCGGWDERVLALRRVRLMTDFPVPRDPLGFARYLWELHFGTNPHVAGQLGPLPLALGALALGTLRSASRPTRVLVLVLAALLVLQFVYMPAVRFGAPLLPFAALAAAVGGVRLARSGRAARLVLAAALALAALHHLRFAAGSWAPRIAAIAEPEVHRRARFPDQLALREMVARAEPVVGIPMGAVFWMPKPVYVLLWQRNGELFFNRTTPPDAARAVLRRRGVRSLVLDVRPPLPPDGTLGHPIVDAWLREGSASLRRDPDPPRARGDRIWVRVDLHGEES